MLSDWYTLGHISGSSQRGAFRKVLLGIFSEAFLGRDIVRESLIETLSEVLLERYS